MSHTRRGFTLIELLVVISIIALLIGILLPALSAARAAARNSTCLSRMHQVAIATNAFASSNKDNLPAAFGGVLDDPLPGGGVGDAKYFTDYLEEYMEVTGDQTTSFYLCPDSTLEPAPGQKRLSYSANPLAMVNLMTALDTVNISDIKRSSDVILVSDAAQNSGAGTSGPTYSGPYMGPFFNAATRRTPLAITQAENIDGITTNGYLYRFRHSSDNSGNAAYIDGHSASNPIGTVLQENLATEY